MRDNDLPENFQNVCYIFIVKQDYEYSERKTERGGRKMWIRKIEKDIENRKMNELKEGCL